MDEILVMFIALFGTICLETLILVFIFWKTPAFTFLKASMLKLPMMYLIGKDRMGYFKTFRSQHGAGKMGKEGLFHLTENSHTLEAGSKIPLYFAFRDLAATLLPEYPAIIQEIRERGIIINNIEDINNYIDDIKKQLKSDFYVQVQPYKTYKMHDLENLFPNNLDPTFIDATVQCEISKGLKTMKMLPIAIGGLIGLMMAAAVAVIIIEKAFKGSMDPGDCQAMVAAAKCSAQPFIQAINSSPIVPG